MLNISITTGVIDLRRKLLQRNDLRLQFRHRNDNKSINKPTGLSGILECLNTENVVIFDRRWVLKFF